MHCEFCRNDNTNHTSEEHVCKKCNKKGLHSYKNCSISSSSVHNNTTRKVVTTTTTNTPSFLAVATRAAEAPAPRVTVRRTTATNTRPTNMTASSSHYFKYNNLFRVLVSMISASPEDKEEEEEEDNNTPLPSSHLKTTVHFEHCSKKFMVDFTDQEQTDKFFDKMYTDSKTITEEFVRSFMKKLAKTNNIKVDLHALHIELFKNFYTVDPSSLDDRFYVTVL